MVGPLSPQTLPGWAWRWKDLPEWTEPAWVLYQGETIRGEVRRRHATVEDRNAVLWYPYDQFGNGLITGATEGDPEPALRHVQQDLGLPGEVRKALGADTV